MTPLQARYRAALAGPSKAKRATRPRQATRPSDPATAPHAGPAHAKQLRGHRFSPAAAGAGVRRVSA